MRFDGPLKVRRDKKKGKNDVMLCDATFQFSRFWLCAIMNQVKGGVTVVNYYSTIQSILQYTRMFFDVVIMWLLLYYAIKIVRNNSRTIQIFKGIVLVLVIKALANLVGLVTVGWLADMFVSWGFIAVIIIFQPEIRSLLERLGKSNVFSRISTLSGNEREHLVDELVKSIMILSKDQTGALVTLEQAHSLSDYVKTGTPMNSVVTAELLTSIFVTSTPLHDGAVIIQGDRIACASAYFPPTNLELPSRYGARHRAAIGISEITDSATIVVSEETGNISIAEAGQITTVSKKELRDYLLRVVCNEETLVREKTQKGEKKSYFVIDSPQMVVEKDTQEDKKTEKSLLNKFVVKKQIKNEAVESTEEPVVEVKKRFSLFGKKKEETADERMEILEKEEENIKLPKKKKKKEVNSSMFEEPQEIAAWEKEIDDADEIIASDSQEDIIAPTQFDNPVIQQEVEDENLEQITEQINEAAVVEVLEIQASMPIQEVEKEKKPRARRKPKTETPKATTEKKAKKKAEEKEPTLLDDVKLEYSTSQDLTSETLSEVVESAEQEGSDAHEE